MNRALPFFTVLASLVAGLVGGMAINNLGGQQSSRADIEAIVGDMLKVDSALPANDTAAGTMNQVDVASLDPKLLNPMIENYLLENPDILVRLSDKLQARDAAEKAEKTRAALAEMNEQIYNGPDQVVLGNPDGDVTLVELFDYNCGYCRSAVPDMLTLLDNDPNLKIILKEFPILSQESADAARIAIAAQREGIDYLSFHTELFATEGRINKQTALDAAAKQGFNPIQLELAAQDESITKTIQTSYQIADAVGASGTPTYIIGDEVIPGAIGLDELKFRIENMRTCGKAMCEG